MLWLDPALLRQCHLVAKAKKLSVHAAAIDAALAQGASPEDAEELADEAVQEQMERDEAERQRKRQQTQRAEAMRRRRRR